MFSIVKRFSAVAFTGAVLLTSGTAAMGLLPRSGQRAPRTRRRAPSRHRRTVMLPAEKLLQSGQEVVVGGPYFAPIQGHYDPTVNISANATKGGAQFDVRYSPDGGSFTRLLQSPVGINAFAATFNMPGFFRVVADLGVTADPRDGLHLRELKARAPEDIDGPERGGERRVGQYCPAHHTPRMLGRGPPPGAVAQGTITRTEATGFG